MSRVKVKSRFDVIGLLAPEFGRGFQSELGQAIVTEMKNDISKGNSPVRTERRYARYKDPEKYPGERKPNRPVNLKLSGEMEKALTFRLVSGRAAVEVGYMGASQDVQARAIAHNTGTPHMAQRKTIPWEEGDQLTVRINRKLVGLYKERLAKLIAKGNK